MVDSHDGVGHISKVLIEASVMLTAGTIRESYPYAQVTICGSSDAIGNYV
jgi:hypothetical protein